MATRWKKEEARKKAEARKGPSPEEVKALDEKEVAEECPSSNHLGRLSLFRNRGSGSSWFDVKPPDVAGSSGGSGWSGS